MKAIKIALVALVAFTTALNGQVLTNPDRTNGLLPKEHVPNRAPVPYAQLREADLMYEKWVWRTIDVREKINHNFYYPLEPLNNRQNLLKIVLDAVQEGSITPYSSADDEFIIPMTKEEVAKIGARTDTLQIPDLYDPNILRDTIVNEKLNPKDVLEWRLKEVWFFDKQRSVMDVRIVGMAPIRYVYDKASGEFKGKETMFWIYFPEARKTFAKTDVFNRFNDSERRTWDDIFWKRVFSSYVIKESNPYDRRIADYKIGMDALIEADRIKGDLMNMEHDLWDF
jgi:gliding motility associated protien GldN